MFFENFDILFLCILIFILLVGIIYFIAIEYEEYFAESREDFIKMCIVSYVLTMSLYGGYKIFFNLFSSGFCGFLISVLLGQIFVVLIFGTSKEETNFQLALHKTGAQSVRLLPSIFTSFFVVFMSGYYFNWNSMTTNILALILYGGINLKFFENVCEAKLRLDSDDKQIKTDKTYQFDNNVVELRSVRKQDSFQEKYGLQRLSAVLEENEEYANLVAVHEQDIVEYDSDSSGYEENYNDSDNFFNTDEENTLTKFNSYSNSTDKQIRPLFQPARFTSHIPWYANGDNAIVHETPTIGKDNICSKISVEVYSNNGIIVSEISPKSCLRNFDSQNNNNNVFSNDFQTYATKSMMTDDHSKLILSDSGIIDESGLQSFDVKISAISDKLNYKITIPVESGHDE